MCVASIFQKLQTHPDWFQPGRGNYAFRGQMPGFARRNDEHLLAAHGSRKIKVGHMGANTQHHALTTDLGNDVGMSIAQLRQALAQLLELLHDSGRTDIVKQELASAFSRLPTRDAVPRLIELTDVGETLAVRSAAHSSLRAITHCGGEMKLSEASREHWSLWWRDHPNSVAN